MRTATHGTPRIIRAAQLPPDAVKKRKKIGPECQSSEPEVEVQRSGDAIQSITVRCPCGETIVIQCEY